MNYRHPNRPEHPSKMRKHTMEERRKIASAKEQEIPSRRYYEFGFRSKKRLRWQ